MKRYAFNLVCILLLVIGSYFSAAQPYSIGIIIKNQPNNPIILGAVKGDNFIAVDSAFAENELVRFSLPDNANTGMYRLIFGQTKYANLMGESPQYLDFIFNKEEIVLETDFDSPETNTRVIQSAENEIWFRFKKKEKELKQQLNELEKEVNYLWSAEKTDQAIDKANEYNQLQIERDLFITQIIKKAGSHYAAQLIQTFQEPLLDGYLTKAQRNELFQREYLKSMDFTDESLIYSQAYTDKVFQYLLSYNQREFTQQQRESAYIKAVDIILSNANKNEKVYEFIQEYLIHGFGVLKLDKVVKYIQENYSATIN